MMVTQWLSGQLEIRRSLVRALLKALCCGIRRNFILCLVLKLKCYVMCKVPKSYDLFNPYFPISINRTSLFLISGVLSGIFHFYSNSSRTFREQTKEILIRRGILRRLIWVCAVCLCPTKWTLGLYGLANYSCGFTLLYCLYFQVGWTRSFRLYQYVLQPR